jgi:NTP pyrophosphatase (non-canonical NTP hydrolase)
MALTEAQLERLDLLQEECGEIIQAVSKIRRFGYDNTHPKKPEGPTNKEHLETELGGLAAVVNLLVISGDIEEDHCELAQLTKETAFQSGKYVKFQEGVLNELKYCSS